MKRLAILGSTGSIGESALKVVRHLAGSFQITALAAKSNIDKLYQQALEFKPQVIALDDPEKAEILQQRLPHTKILSGIEGICEISTLDEADMVIAAMVGTAGIAPTLAAVEAGKTIALANKEALVSAGSLVISKAAQHHATILPVDSEHSALFQCLQGEDRAKVRRLILTASGGPFRSWTLDQLSTITVDMALQHPNWNMGPKITIDCSTLMNKGLEVLEAHWLYGIPLDQIEVVIHPQSIIHSMVEFVDGSIMAQMGVPDMVTAVQYAMTYPHRQPSMLQPFDFTKHNKLEFGVPDYERFRCLGLAYKAGQVGGTLPTFMNAANEVLVERFVKGEVSWSGIGHKLANLMSQHSVQPNASLQSILAVDRQARHEASYA